MHFWLYLHSPSEGIQKWITSGGKLLRDLSLVNAKVAQLVEHDLAKVGVASSNLVFRSNPFHKKGFIVKGFIYLLKDISQRQRTMLRWWNW